MNSVVECPNGDQPQPQSQEQAQAESWRRTREALTLFRERFTPFQFPPKPLAIGVTDSLLVEAQAFEISKTLVRRVIGIHTHSLPYLRALAAEGSQRHDLAGNPVEAVSDEHRQKAREMLRERALAARAAKAKAKAKGKPATAKPDKPKATQGDPEKSFQRPPEESARATKEPRAAGGQKGEAWTVDKLKTALQGPNKGKPILTLKGKR